MTIPIQPTKLTRAALHMDTLVTIQLVSAEPTDLLHRQLDRAFTAFTAVEQVCSRFSPESELRQLCQKIGAPTPVSPLLFEAIRIALEIADLTEGVFDPTIGHHMESQGFNRNYLTGEKTLPPPLADLHVPATYRDVLLDEETRTVLLQKPLRLDLGAVAKGLAVDLAAQELRSSAGFLINAGGDVYAGGLNERGEPWQVGIQHPTQPHDIITSLSLTNAAICTSGSYERISRENPNTHHLLDPRTGTSASQLLSCSVVAPFAMLADAFSTAAFLLGPVQGQELLQEAGLTGIFITPDLHIHRGEEV
ncbi:FAD:protein FMN transferase [Tumebacillus sp. ITR2]|uniref:FAD:protein FMN transferase n=1 Tax=Tumebacillus amylolyticus TaxID=2801339 RepID=A0ABS1J6G6_9BACL|nr:FAD:protein FMN transferase [Tumebacillus amylolyticus]MBL0385258.1 FAD:protein FMN transferase [Tumebacillus amylolyticus]